MPSLHPDSAERRSRRCLGVPLGELALSDDRGGQDGIGGGDAGGDDETLEPVQRGHHPPDEETRDEPAERHDGDEEEGDGLPVALQVELWQLDADGEALDNEDDAGELDGDEVDVAPFEGVYEVGGLGAEDDAAECRDGGFTDVHALLDDRGAEHEEGGEATEDDIHQMGIGDGEVIPRHREDVGDLTPGVLFSLAS